MKKLIFIDDSLLDHFILKRILTRYNLDYSVSCTSDATEVIVFLEHNRHLADELPDIILLDIYMPGFDGWDFLDKVQYLYPYLAKPVKIYILSSSVNPADIECARKYTCVRSFIFKPITKEVLEKHIDDESPAA